MFQFIYFIIKFVFLQFYPCFITFKAIKQGQDRDHISLLTFWVVSVLFLSIEYFTDIFLFWIPFYTEIKLIFLIWLILPQTQGSVVFYSRYIEPFFNQHESTIEKTLISIQEKLKTMIFSWLKGYLPTTATKENTTEETSLNPYSLFTFTIKPEEIRTESQTWAAYASSWIWNTNKKNE
ncbi:unnamed protein product [Rhizopus stolonifer]